MERIFNLKLNIFLLVFGFILIYSLRVLYLDSDVKSFELAQIQPIDELYYNEVGINLYHYGIQSLTSGELEKVSVANAKLFLLPSLLTSISMEIFGSNYWGLKMGNVFMGLLCGLLLVFLSNRLSNGNTIANLFVSIFFVFDFNILMLSREAVTVIPCMLATMIYASGLLFIKNKNARLFFIGFWPVISFCLIYGGLPFLALFSLGYMIYLWNDGGRKKKDIIIFLVGGLAGIILCETIDYVIFRQHVWEIIIDTMVAHGGKVSGISIVRYPYNLIEYFISNTYRYNFFFLVSALWSFFICAYYIYKTQNEKVLIIVGLVFAHIVQIFLMPNMTLSKAAITYPLVLLMIVLSVKFYHQELSVDISMQKYAMKALTPIVILAMFFQIVGLWRHKSLDTFDLEVSAVVALMIIGLFLVAKKKKKIVYTFPAAMLSILLMCFLSYKYIFSDITYNDKNIMIDLSKTVGNNPIINGKGFMLYNNIHSFVDDYDHYHGVGYNEKTVSRKIDSLSQHLKGDLFFLGYCKNGVASLNSRLYKYGVRFVPKKKYYRRFVYNGECYHMCLYKREKI